jgi:glycosyltransferase involved in cell wall biosynthesis
MAVDSRIQDAARLTLEVVRPGSEEPPSSLVRFPGQDATISVIIPTLNEERNVAWVLERVPSLVDEIIIVDGRSTDRTIDVALAIRPDAVVIREPRPGKGIALRTAFEAATGDIVVMLDADCSMEPAEIERFVAAIEDGADLVKGSRNLPGGGSVDISLLRRIGNNGLLLVSNVLYGASFTELCYGYMAFRRSRLVELQLKSTGFEIETEIVVRAVRAGLRIAEVASFESHRRYGTSHLNTFRDGWRVLKTLVRERFRRERRIFRIEEPVTLLQEVAVPISVEEPKGRQQP